MKTCNCSSYRLIKLKARLLCEGLRPDESVAELFRAQNPSGVKRGGLSSGGKMILFGNFFSDSRLPVNAPFYQKRDTALTAQVDSKRERGILIFDRGKRVCRAEVIAAPGWYGKSVRGFAVTRILTAHNRQLAGAVYEDCVLFSTGSPCRFCVMNQSLTERDPALIRKDSALFLEALAQIPVEEYGGLTLNGGMTTYPGRGMELVEPVVHEIHRAYPNLPIAVEMTPPADMGWIDRIIEAGVSSLMMNLECWDEGIRRWIIPGKNTLCPKGQYLAAFERAFNLLGPGRVSTCFVVGCEPEESLKEGIRGVVELGVIPSPLAGRYFEDVPDYPFTPNTNWKKFLGVLRYVRDEMSRHDIRSTDRAGCVACGMCDLIRDLVELREYVNSIVPIH